MPKAGGGDPVGSDSATLPLRHRVLVTGYYCTHTAVCGPLDKTYQTRLVRGDLVHPVHVSCAPTLLDISFCISAESPTRYDMVIYLILSFPVQRVQLL